MFRRIMGTLLMIVFFFGTVDAMAGGDFTELDVSISKDGNGKSVKAEIESIYEDCKRTGEWTLEALKRVHRLNEPYRELGGNGTVKKIVQYMEDKCTESKI